MRARAAPLHRRVGGNTPFSQFRPQARALRRQFRIARPRSSTTKTTGFRLPLCFTCSIVAGMESGWLDMWKAFLAINRVTMAHAHSRLAANKIQYGSEVIGASPKVCQSSRGFPAIRTCNRYGLAKFFHGGR